MKFLKAITMEGKEEYFNINNILSIQPLENGYYKILMGAGLFWKIKPETVEFLEVENIFNINK